MQKCISSKVYLSNLYSIETIRDLVQMVIHARYSPAILFWEKRLVSLLLLKTPQSLHQIVSLLPFPY